MDPKVLLLLPGLTAGLHKDHVEPSVRSLTPPPVPIYEWPERQERSEQDHPAQEDPSPMYRGLVYSNINVSNTAVRTITVDSTASASVHVPRSLWPENNLSVVDSVDDLEVGARITPKSHFLNLAASLNASRNMANPSTIEIRRSITRRQR